MLENASIQMFVIVINAKKCFHLAVISTGEIISTDYAAYTVFLPCTDYGSQDGLT
jgi:hypothetical protein